MSISSTTRTETIVRRGLTAVVFTIAALTFAFGFGNVWNLALRLGVPGWVAPLVAPAVDLSVMALLTALAYLRAHGVEGRLIGPRLLLAFCGLVTLALNTAHPILAGEYGRAAFDGIAPVLLIFWSDVGPRLLASLHGTVPDEPVVVPGPSPSIPDEGPAVPSELVDKARQLNAEHRKVTGRPITRDRLRAQLKVSNAVAGALVRHVRSVPDDPP